jgi:hypothetical protein
MHKISPWLRKPVLRFLHGAVHDPSITGLNDRRKLNGRKMEEE